MLRRVISGGQTGADQGGLRSAIKAGYEPGGWMPWGFPTENGRLDPTLVKLFRLQEMERTFRLSPKGVWEQYVDYPSRTRKNAADSDMTLWFDVSQGGDRSGYWCTRKSCNAERFWEIRRPDNAWREPLEIAQLLHLKQYQCINIAGNRESKSPGIGAKVEAWCDRMFEEYKKLVGDPRP